MSSSDSGWRFRLLRPPSSAPPPAARGAHRRGGGLPAGEPQEEPERPAHGADDGGPVEEEVLAVERGARRQVEEVQADRVLGGGSKFISVNSNACWGEN